MKFHCSRNNSSAYVIRMKNNAFKKYSDEYFGII